MSSFVELLALFVLVGVASTLTIHDYHELEDKHYVTHKHIPILKHEHKQGKDGYKFSFQGGNGIHAEESGFIKNKGDKKHETLVQHGSVTYHDEHGHPITLTYVADEHGFRPQGDHLPTPPPLPAEHYKVLAEHSAIAAEHEGLDIGGGGGGEELLEEHYGHF